MRVLLLHPEASLSRSSWSQKHWDLVVDLAHASRHIYAEYSRTLNTRVLSIYEYAGVAGSYEWVNQLFNHGRGKLLDRVGLDWWDLLSVGSYQDLQLLCLFERLRDEINQSSIELWASHPHHLVRIAEQVFGQSARYLHVPSSAERPAHRALRILRSARNLRASQIVEIAFDKWDPGYRLRRHWAGQNRARLSQPAVLLPSAYSNVTRSTLAYAMQLPERKFLLATTRHNAIPKTLPQNVALAPLAAYARPAKAVREETDEMKVAWRAFIRTMIHEKREFRDAVNAGLWDYFPAQIEQGLRLRDAWQHLLSSEPVTGVLCGDDLNYHTRLPLLLAQRDGLNAVYCSHGALDGGFLFKTAVANEYLVKGEMEADYLRFASFISPEQIVTAAPGKCIREHPDERRGEALVFFSQPYEVSGGRADSIYREILPHLCSAAKRSGRKIIVKLHPFESKRGRKALLKSVLPRETLAHVEIVEGVPPAEVMSRAWCGVTVDSSVAVECALQKIPFFLCGWLDFTGLGYLEQFARFGAAQVLNAPEEIAQIPELIAVHRASPTILERLWKEADPKQLDEIMFGPRNLALDQCAS